MAGIMYTDEPTTHVDEYLEVRSNGTRRPWQERQLRAAMRELLASVDDEQGRSLGLSTAADLAQRVLDLTK